jgi:hypothetical protein
VGKSPENKFTLLAAHPWLLAMLTAIEQGNSAALLAAIDKGQAAVGSAGR